VIRHIVYTWKLFQKSKTANCIFALDPVSVGVPAAVVSKIRNAPLLLRLGGDYAWEQGKQRYGVLDTLDEFVHKPHTYSWQVRLLVCLERWVAKSAKRVIVPSQYLGRIIEAWGVDAKNIQVIYSAHKPLNLEKTKAQYKDAYGYTYPTIISVGRLVPWKGFTELIDAVAFLKKEFPTIRLLIGGDGEQKEFLETHAHALGVADQVSFLGALSRHDMACHVAAADVFVLNTSYEGLSHQLLEVMEVGTPIITTIAGGNTELVTSGKEGLLVSVKDTPALVEAMKEMLANKDLQTTCTTEAAKRVKEFSDEAMIAKLVALIHSIHE
jgi:glycosyltransferase involved in cell wall biosynthesis